MNFKELATKLKKNSIAITPATDKQIKDAERMINTWFSPHYKDYLKTIGSLNINDEIVAFGLGVNMENTANVVRMIISGAMQEGGQIPQTFTYLLYKKDNNDIWFYDNYEEGGSKGLIYKKDKNNNPDYAMPINTEYSNIADFLNDMVFEV